VTNDRSGERGNRRAAVRFAPSPNGWLHLGHAFSALTTAQAAAELGARLVLRIEDIDVGRCRPEYETGIYEDLAWLGLEWERPVRRQSEHFHDYEAALKRLEEMELVYPCFATRGEIVRAIEETGIPLARWPRDPDGAPIYPGIYKDLSRSELNRLLWEGKSYSLRLDMERAIEVAEAKAGGPLSFVEEGEGPNGETGVQRVDGELFGDVVIARKDLPTSYHLAVTHDDAAQGITHVTRGQDLFFASHVHRILQVLLDWPEPVYRHHRLIRDLTGRRLSKTAKDQGMRDLRDEGIGIDELKEMIGFGETV